MQLQPLRIPTGWCVTCNNLLEIDPTVDQIKDGFYGLMSIFMAVHEHGRFLIDVEWRPYYDPNGRFHIWLDYAPWERTERGRRRKDVPVSYRNSERVREFQTASRIELVRTLEEWMERCHAWRHEAN